MVKMALLLLKICKKTENVCALFNDSRIREVGHIDDTRTAKDTKRCDFFENSL